MRHLAIFWIIALTVSAFGQPGKIATLDSLIAEALQNNPQLRAARHQATAAYSRTKQATAWDAPEIGVEFYQTPVQSFPDPFRDQTEYDYYLQQMFPFPGKLSAMGSMARNNAKMMDQSAAALERKIIRDLKSAYYEIYLVQHKIAINAENQELMRKFTEIATKQYQVGIGKQPDILRAQTELSLLVTEGLNLQKEKRVAEAMINTLTNRPADQPLGYVPDIETLLPQWSYVQLQPLALESRAELKAMNYGIAMAKAELSLSKKEYYPDLMGRVMYKDMTMTGNDFWSAMVGVNVPLAFWSSRKYAAKVEENEVLVRRAEEEYQNMKNMTLFEVQDALVNVQTNQNLVLLYKNTVIPQAERTLQSTSAAYQTGKTEFLMLIDAYRMLLMARLDYHTAIMNYMSSQAQLEQSVGLNTFEIAAKIQ
jgi:cobalt-zinc-cadmium efflux system outer membrane protein